MGPEPKDILSQLLDYDPDTGILRWKFVEGATSRGDKIRNTRFAGMIAGSYSPRSGLVVWISGKSYLAHRVAWVLMTGEDVPYIRHLNGDLADNRWSNLRSVTRPEIYNFAIEAKAREYARQNFPDDPGEEPC